MWLNNACKRVTNAHYTITYACLVASISVGMHALTLHAYLYTPKKDYRITIAEIAFACVRSMHKRTFACTHRYADKHEWMHTNTHSCIHNYTYYLHTHLGYINTYIQVHLDMYIYIQTPGQGPKLPRERNKICTFL